MKSYKKSFSLLAGFLISFLVASPVFASFNGILPVANVGASPTAATIGLSNYNLSAGQTATVTFTFPAAPISFTTSDITASNGTISNLAVTGDPKVYTATFTPTTAINVSTNTISVAAKNTTTTYSVPGNPEAITFDGTNMWTANYGSASVSKITPTGTVTTYGGLGSDPAGIAFDGTNIWTSSWLGNSVSKITSSGATSTFAVAGGPYDIAYDGLGHMWTANYGGNSVSEISSTGTVMHTYSSGIGNNPSGIAFDGTNMWVANMTDSSVTKVTPTGTTTTFSVGWNPVHIAFDGTNMWTANDIGSNVTKITPTGTTTNFSVAGDPYGIAFDGTNMWTANYNASTISEISSTGTVIATYGVGNNPQDIAFDGTNMWTANYGGNSVTEIGFSGAGSSANYSINTIVVAPPAPTVNHGGGHAVAVIHPIAINSSPLDFTINNGTASTNNPSLMLTFNADPNTVKGYAVSLEPTFADAGIQTYTNGTTGTFQLPNSPGTYTIYLEYFSTTGNHSSVISHTISYQANGSANNIVDSNQSNSTTNSFTRTLQFGSSGSDVALLQKVLVQDGELVLPNNSAYGNFGKLTQTAVKKFQIKYGIAKSGTQGYGIFGPKTQEVAMKIGNKE